MSSSNRTTKIKSLHKFLQKRYKDVPQTQSRKVLEHLIYAACLENATFEQADDAFSVLEHHYIDWNEIRVSTANELAYTFPHLPDAVTAGDRIRKTLQAVFEVTYMFDLEDLRKKNLSQAVDFLGSLNGCSRFMVDYTTHNALGGHVIPMDESALRVFRLLGLAQTNKENTREIIGGLERAITKQEGYEFANRLHHFAVEFYRATNPNELQLILKPMDSQAVNRGWTAPALVIAKPVRPEKRKPVIPPLAAVTVIDDDIDTTEAVNEVEEVEFIPNPITGEESSYEIDDVEEDEISVKPPLPAKGTLKTAGKTPAKTSAKTPAKTTGKPTAKPLDKTTLKTTGKPPVKVAKKDAAVPKKNVPKNETDLKSKTKKAEVKKADEKKPKMPVPVPPEKKKKENVKSPKILQVPKPTAKKPTAKKPTIVSPASKPKAKITKKDVKKAALSQKSKTSPIKKLRQKKPK